MGRRTTVWLLGAGAVVALVAVALVSGSRRAPAPAGPTVTAQPADDPEVRRLIDEAAKLPARTAAARQAAARALERCRSVGGAADLEAECLALVGRCQLESGDAADAHESLVAALAKREPRGDLTEARIQLQLGRACKRLAELTADDPGRCLALSSEAAERVGKAVKLLNKWLPTGDEFAEAESLQGTLRAEYPIRETLAHVQRRRDEAYARDGHPGEAEQLLSDALAGTALTPERRNLEADLLHARGSVRYQMKKYEDAKKDFVRVAEIRKALPVVSRLGVARALAHLALIAHAESKGADTQVKPALIADSMRWDEEALTFLDDAKSTDVALAAKVRVRLAESLRQSGDPARASSAEGHVRRAMAVRDRMKELDRAKLLIGIGAIYRKDGPNLGLARDCYEEAYQTCLKTVGRKHLMTATCLVNLAYLDGVLKFNFSEVDARMGAAAEIARDVLAEYAAGQSDDVHVLMLGQFRKYLDAYLSYQAVLRELPLAAVVPNAKAAPPERVYSIALQWKGMMFARQLWLRRFRDHTDPHIAATLKELADALRERTALLSGHRGADEDDGPTRRSELEARCERLFRRIDELTGPAVRTCDWVKWTPAGVQRNLPEGAVLLDFVSFDRYLPLPLSKFGGAGFEKKGGGLVAFVVGKDHVEVVQMPDFPKVKVNVAKWLNAVQDPKDPDPELVRGLAQELAKSVWDPLQDAIMRAVKNPPAGGVKRLYVSPDGPLNHLPFGALPGKLPGWYLVEEYEISVLPTPGLVTEVVAGKEATPTLLAVNEVDVGLSDGEDEKPLFPPLLEADRTVQRAHLEKVRKLFRTRFPSAPVIEHVRAEATAEAFRRDASKATVVDLFLHGYSDRPALRFARQPSKIDLDPAFGASAHEDRSKREYHGQASGLAFGGANRPDRRGTLSAAEIAEIDLGGAQLVVIAACLSNRGRDVSGEGALSVQRAVQVAGSKASVGTLWKVSPTATRDLLGDFYANYFVRRLPPAAAMREAQLKMLRVKPHPFYWAAWSVCN